MTVRQPVDRHGLRILVVRLSAFGDIIHTLPVIAALRRGCPDARIDWIVDHRYQALVDLVPAVDHRISWPRSGARLPAFVRTVSALRRRTYDLALDAQGLLKSALAARLSGAKRVVGFHPTGLREPASSWLHTEHAPEARGVHVIERNLTLVTHLGVQTESWEFPLDATLAPAGTQDALAQPKRDHERFVVMNPGAAWPSKAWSPSRYGAVAQRLEAECRLPSLVTWGPGEKQLAEAVVEASDGTAMLAPPTDIAGLVYLIRSASLFIGGDTGPLHLAAAVRTPVVGVYGPSDPARNGPWDPDDEIVSPAEPCYCAQAMRAAGSRGVIVRRCEQLHPCLSHVSSDDVFEAARRRLRC